MKQKTVLSLLISAAPLLATAAATDAQLQQCRAIADKTARLACYDALPVVTAPTAAVPPRPASAVEMKLPPPVPHIAPAPPAEAAAKFGLEQREVKQVERIESQITGSFEGWNPGTRIRLANGQVWQVSDDSRASLYLQNPKVVVRRAAMGTFILEIEGSNQAPRVRRID
ncbi:hypothetical protein J7U46_17050 [Pelomonas sp. V22]|uniref:hypothetical protein n=1 Tax=Pelomonas sp. V22 TaxID=2822139 RepID=UPI0024A8CC6F|nr:hypothetical protein [Pelomonas sp. V22]MDI4634772.1 hypothetical protein [Pelomonas sp. V22]